MKFYIEKESLVKTLNKVTALYNNDSDMEILECLFLEIENNMLTLKCTNLMCKMISVIKVESNIDGQVVVNFKSLYGIVKNLSEPKLLMYIENNQLVIKTKTKKFSISTYSPDNYPEIIIDNAEKINIDTGIFIKVLGKFDKIFGKEFPTNHLCFSSNSDIIELIGTNGNRLTYCNLNNKTGKDFKILIDDRSLSILKGFLKSGESFEFEMGNREIIVHNNNNKLIVNFHQEFKFPPYNVLLGIKYANEILIKKSELEEVLKLLTINLKEDKLVMLNITSSEFIISYKSATFECEQSIAIENGKETLMKLSAEHLLDSIKNVNEAMIRISYNDKTTPLKIYSEGYVAFITLCNI